MKSRIYLFLLFLSTAHAGEGGVDGGGGRFASIRLSEALQLYCTLHKEHASAKEICAATTKLIQDSHLASEDWSKLLPKDAYIQTEEMISKATGISLTTIEEPINFYQKVPYWTRFIARTSRNNTCYDQYFNLLDDRKENLKAQKRGLKRSLKIPGLQVLTPGIALRTKFVKKDYEKYQAALDLIHDSSSLAQLNESSRIAAALKELGFSDTETHRLWIANQLILGLRNESLCQGQTLLNNENLIDWLRIQKDQLTTNAIVEEFKLGAEFWCWRLEEMSKDSSDRELKDLSVRFCEKSKRLDVRVREQAEIAGERVDAENFSSPNEKGLFVIELTFSSWMGKNYLERNRLAFHEVLGVIRAQDPGYSVSTKISALIEEAIRTPSFSPCAKQAHKTWDSYRQGASGLLYNNEPNSEVGMSSNFPFFWPLIGITKAMMLPEHLAVLHLQEKAALVYQAESNQLTGLALAQFHKDVHSKHSIAMTAHLIRQALRKSEQKEQKVCEGISIRKLKRAVIRELQQPE